MTRVRGCDPEFGERLVEKMRVLNEQIDALVAVKFAMHRSYEKKIKALRGRVAALDRAYRRGCRCVATVRVFVGYTHKDRRGDPCGRARYEQRRCLNRALVGGYLCGVHHRANSAHARRATEAEDRA